MLREPPAFQFYASDVTADEAFVLASLEERGLFISLQAYAWVNRTTPADLTHLARCLGLNEAAVISAYGNLVKKHFIPCPSDKSRLFEPELERQRQAMAERRARLADGGRKGGRTTQAKHRIPARPSSLALKAAKNQVQASERSGEDKKRGEERQVYRECALAEHEKWLIEFNDSKIDEVSGK